MIRKPKAGYVLGLVATLFVVAVQACSDQLSPLAELNSAQVSASQGPAASKLGDVLTVASECLNLKPGGVAVDIGPQGGEITLCGNTLKIPTHSLNSMTHIVMLPVLGTPGAVQFFPEGLVFNNDKWPELTLSTDPVGNPKNAYIVYTDNQGNVLEKLPTTWGGEHYVTSKIHHFSRYAVAW